MQLRCTYVTCDHHTRSWRLLCLAGLSVAALSLWAADQKSKPLNHPEPPAPERVQKSTLTAEVSQQLPRSSPIPVRRRNRIDEFVFGAMERDKIPHALLATDQEFLRRIYLDLTGRIPDSATVRKFLSDETPDKRD